MLTSQGGKALTRKLLLTEFLIVLGFAATEGFACEDPTVEHPHEEAAGTAAEVNLETIRSRVLRRCGLSEKLADNHLPWYFHYEYGVELIREGAAVHAIEPLQMTANLRAEPARATRMYGMWFVNYIPYFQMSLAWSELGEWDQAWDAIRLSEELHEVSPADAEYEQYTELKQLIESNRRTAG